MELNTTKTTIQRSQIFIKGEDKTDEIISWRLNGKKVDITFYNGKTYSYNKKNVRFVKSALVNPLANNCFKYLLQIAQAVGLDDTNGKNILASRYEKIDYLSKNSMLSSFLLGQLKVSRKNSVEGCIYPFGFNISQKNAVENALIHHLSIIEGPPGTGKTQTILNIIANAVMCGESVAVVSNNNSATANVLEKLKKYNVDFIAAYLGNTDNKQEFIVSQKPLPDLLGWKLLRKRSSLIKKTLKRLSLSLDEMLEKKNELSRLKQQLDNIKLEYEYFKKYCDEIELSENISFKNNLASADALKLWLKFEQSAKSERSLNLFIRFINWIQYLINRIRYGVGKEFYNLAPEFKIVICQKEYYCAKLRELNNEITILENCLSSFNFDEKMQEYSDLSAEVFCDKLAEKYKKSERTEFSIDDLWKNSQKFVDEYPVILSTTYSLRSSLNHKVMYDYVIVDESSQVDLATGALALSCAKKAVIVGDLKQLPNVVDRNTAKKTDEIFSRFDLPEVYRYKNHNLLSSATELFPDAPKILLREHYRCHPKIIEYCNQKFYNNELIVLTEPKTNRQPLVVYQTVEGNHARDRINQRQIDVIKDEIIPQQKLNTEKDSIGIVTPYRDQTNALQSAFSGTTIKADTVDKFQGRENDIIVLSTVDNEVNQFSDNANRLNVAVSRAVQQLIVVVSHTDTERDTNIGDLVRYIRYNNMEVIQSDIYSVFDYLYKGYYDKCIALLASKKRVSEYDSENLMFNLINEILQNEHFSKHDVAVNVPLKMIIRDFSKLNEEETRYAKNMLTHVDFLIFDKIDKSPRLIVEVDGVRFHKDGTRQAYRDKLKNTILEKYGLKYLRFKTNESRETERLINAFSHMLNQ